MNSIVNLKILDSTKNSKKKKMMMNDENSEQCEHTMNYVIIQEFESCKGYRYEINTRKAASADANVIY